MIFVPKYASKVVFKGGILGAMRQFWGNPYLNSTIVLFDKEDMVELLSTAWRLAQMQIEKAHVRQKDCHDKKANQPPNILVGDRVYIYNPSKKRGKAYKLARSFEGPYRVLNLHPNGADLQNQGPLPSVLLLTGSDYVQRRSLPNSSTCLGQQGC